ncbi:MAG: CHAT domain-containing protein [Rhizonema sp. PD37]|nr:CHAT domain-containing protein [Rhizonema sp. PD37]
MAMNMRINKFSLIVFSTLLLTGLQSVWPNPVTFGKPAVVAQTPDARKAEADRLLQQGNEQFQTSQFEAALKFWSQALIIYREIKNRQGESQSLGNLGNAYYFLGNYVLAIDYQQQSLAIARSIKDRLGESHSLGSLGVAYDSLGNYALAIDYQQQRLAIAREIKDRLGESQSLGNLGNTYYSLGNYALAIDYQQQRLAIAREIKDRLGESHSLGNLGLAYDSLGNYALAIDYQQQHLAIAREIKDLNGEGTGLNNLGLALYKSGKLVEAEKILRTGIERWESLRDLLGKNDSYKISIFEEQASIYRILQQVLIAQNKTSLALEISERGRSRAFVELLTSRLVHKTTSQTLEPTVAKPTLSLLQQIAKQQNATLVEYSINYYGLKIQGKLEAKESEIYIWVIKPTGEIHYRKSDLKPLWQKENTTLAEFVTTSRNSIGARGTAFRGSINVTYNPDAPKATNKLKRLHELLINPIADLLPKNPNDRLIFIPQRSLFLVPFPALQNEQGKYLVEKHTILTAPSIQVLDLTHLQRLGNRKSKVGSGGEAIVVGNPTMPSVPPHPGDQPQQLASLPGAEKEVKAIAPLLNTKAITGSQATKASILQLLPRARIIHLATHGIFDDIRGLGSAIALAPDSSPPKPGEINGLLTAEEILDLKLQAELVVLSACDTGRGKITGDGVIGLSRSLISAGVPSVMVSLWSIPDAPTAELMSQFYTNLQQRHMDKAQALRQAMLTTMKSHPNPVDWAAFTLIGESE